MEKIKPTGGGSRWRKQGRGSGLGEIFPKLGPGAVKGISKNGVLGQKYPSRLKAPCLKKKKKAKREALIRGGK